MVRGATGSAAKAPGGIGGGSGIRSGSDSTYISFGKLGSPVMPGRFSNTPMLPKKLTMFVSWSIQGVDIVKRLRVHSGRRLKAAIRSASGLVVSITIW